VRELDARAFDSADCRFPGCPREATHTDGMCRDHHGHEPLAPGAVTGIRDSRGRLIPGSLAHLMEDDDPLEKQIAEGRVHPAYIEPGSDITSEVMSAMRTLAPAAQSEQQEEPVTDLPWTRDEITEAIQNHALQHGAPPTSTDWAKAAPGRPSADLVKRRFGGSWADAIVAAGFPRPLRGGAGKGRTATIVKPPPGGWTANANRSTARSRRSSRCSRSRPGDERTRAVHPDPARSSRRSREPRPPAGTGRPRRSPRTPPRSSRGSLT